MSQAYKVIFECPNGPHTISLQRKSTKGTLSEPEVKKLFSNDEISCAAPRCGWHGKASKLKLRQIVPFNWIHSPAAV